MFPLTVLVILQIFDLCTTMVFLSMGIQEANPLINWIISVTGDPIIGVFLPKLLAVGLGLYCFATHRYKLLTKVNVFYACVIAWNLLAIYLGGGF